MELGTELTGDSEQEKAWWQTAAADSAAVVAWPGLAWRTGFLSCLSPLTFPLTPHRHYLTSIVLSQTSFLSLYVPAHSSLTLSSPLDSPSYTFIALLFVHTLHTYLLLPFLTPLCFHGGRQHARSMLPCMADMHTFYLPTTCLPALPLPGSFSPAHHCLPTTFLPTMPIHALWPFCLLYS